MGSNASKAYIDVVLLWTQFQGLFRVSSLTSVVFSSIYYNRTTETRSYQYPRLDIDETTASTRPSSTETDGAMFSPGAQKSLDKPPKPPLREVVTDSRHTRQGQSPGADLNIFLSFDAISEDYHKVTEAITKDDLVRLLKYENN